MIHWNHAQTPLVDPNTKQLPKVWSSFFQQVAENTNTHFDNEIPTGTINGTNKVFTLFAAPNPLACLQLFQKNSGGTAFLLIQGIDYTIAKNVVTLTTAPPSGSTLRAFYRQ